MSCKLSPNVKCLLEKINVSSICCLLKMPRVLTINFQQMTFINSFLIFSQKTGFDISCTLSRLEIVCMKCQILLAGKTKKVSSSADIVQRVERLEELQMYFCSEQLSIQK